MNAIVAYGLRSRGVSLACLIVVAAALALPPGGLRLPVCQFKTMTHLPCLTCGMTRSFVSMAHLQPGRAAFYHPLGVLLFPCVLAAAGLLPVRPVLRERLARWAEARPRMWNMGGIGLLAAAVVYGVGRMLWVLLARGPSPW